MSRWQRHSQAAFRRHKEAFVRVRNLTLIALGALFAVGAAAPAFADEDWRHHERQEWRHQDWRHQQWREHEWREHEWREHEWREHQRFYGPPPVSYGYPGYYR